ncbi:MAG TPA: family 10 glycosylhydrolase, partial [Candidatus Eisenbacteria bacterium]|nr:family 10 glycosylhydrolase [Candidatus Eisenbacteria bacterium]
MTRDHSAPARKNAPARFLWVTLVMMVLGVRADAAPPAGQETRALWVVRHAITTPGRVDQVVDIASQLHINTLLVQVRGRGDAYYKSDLAPRGEALGDADFDPLERIIRRAHDQGIEVHAWINVYLIWSAGDLPRSGDHIVNAHPEWISIRADGRRLVEMVPEEFEDQRLEGMYLAPGNPEVRRHLREVVREITSKYAVDGIHLDYVRYPEPGVGYDPPTRTAFQQEFGVDPIHIEQPDSVLLEVIGPDRIPDLKMRWIQWKKDRITDLVRDLRADLDRNERGIKLTAAVIADQQAALNRYHQDWPAWLREGIVDAVIPMAYGTSTATVERQIKAAMAIPTERHVYAGIAIYNQGARDAAEKIRRARALGVDGIALFSFDALVGKAGYMRQIKSSAFARPTTPTKMPWRGKG